jgi:hypothetical protein
MADLCERWSDVESGLAHESALDGGLREHLAQCGFCANEAASQKQLRARLAELSREEAVNPFHLKKLRRELLLRAKGTVAPAARPMRAWAIALASAAAAALLFFFVGRLTMRPSEAVSVSANPGARFSEKVADGRHVVELVDGEFDFDVNHRDGEPHLLVRVPDGEIEDIGTKFHVSVSNGRTVRVSVTEGEVELRRTNEPKLRLIAGMTFTPSPVPAPSSSASSAQVSSAPVAPSLATAPAPSAISSAPFSPPAPVVAVQSPAPKLAALSPRAVATTKHEASAFESNPTQAQESAVESERASRAARGLSEEDRAYLAVLRALNGQDKAAVRRLADDYLARFPQGFRQREIEALRKKSE